MIGRAALLPEPQMEEVFQAIAQAGFDRQDFKLENQAIWVRVAHKVSGSYFVIHRDATWRFVGHYAIGAGPESLFDLLGCRSSPCSADGSAPRAVVGVGKRLSEAIEAPIRRHSTTRI
jgi:hypothetical protein